jgi:hypothetical protein
MPIYGRDEDNQRFIDELQQSNDEYHQKLEQVKKIFEKDIPPFLARALASRIVGREKAKELQASFTKNQNIT